MILNLIILVFLGGMFYYWGAVQGLFSAVLHLAATIVAGAIALALWEPLVHGFLLNRMPEYAWGVGLVGPFILLLIAIRVALDKLIKANMHFSVWVNTIAGGFLGLLAGILASGIAVIGIGMLPLPGDFLGWSPLAMGDDGKVLTIEEARKLAAMKNDDKGMPLWIKVDHMTASFYSGLSDGALAPGFPTWNGASIPIHRGDLAELAQLRRLRYHDAHASISAVPQGLSIPARLEHDLPWKDLSDGPLAKALQLGADAGKKLVILDTHWEKAAGASGEATGSFDSDNALRLGSTQVRLVGWKMASGKPTSAELFAPLAAGQVSVGNTERTLVPFNNRSNFAAVNDKGDIAWAFVLPADIEPKFLLVRDLRLNLPEAGKTESGKVIEIMGRMPRIAVTGAPKLGAPEPGRTGLAAEDIEATDALPLPASSNMTGNLNLNDHMVYAGSSEVKPVTELTADTRVDRFSVPPHQRMVRVKIKADFAQSIFGKSVQAAKMLEPVFLTDAQGNPYHPVGYVLLRSDKSQKVMLDRQTELRAARQLPIAEMQTGDELYVYFLLPRGVMVTSYNLGNSTKQVVNLNLN